MAIGNCSDSMMYVKERHRLGVWLRICAVCLCLRVCASVSHVLGLSVYRASVEPKT